jgi:hypothetical protein
VIDVNKTPFSDAVRGLISSISTDLFGRSLDSVEEIEGFLSSYDNARGCYRYCQVLVEAYNDGTYPHKAPDVQVVSSLRDIAAKMFFKSAPEDAYGRQRLTLTDLQKKKIDKLIRTRFGGSFEPIIQKLNRDGSNSPLIKTAGDISAAQIEIRELVSKFQRLQSQVEHSAAKNLVPVFVLFGIFGLVIGAVLFSGRSNSSDMFGLAFLVAAGGTLLVYLNSSEKVAALEKESGEIARRLVVLRGNHREDSEKFESLRGTRQQGDLWWRSLKGIALENELHDVFQRLGFQVQKTPASRDGGIDLRVDLNGKAYLIQCKGWSDKVGVAPIRELIGAASGSKESVVMIFVSTAGFSDDALFAARAVNMMCWDSSHLAALAANQLHPFVARTAAVHEKVSLSSRTQSVKPSSEVRVDLCGYHEGSILRIRPLGSAVRRGDVLAEIAVLQRGQSTKTELKVFSDHDGFVSNVSASVGDRVGSNTLLLTVQLT